MTVVEKIIMAKLNNNGEKMDKIGVCMEKMESSIFSLQQENDQLKREMEELKRKGEAMRSGVDTASIRARRADDRSNFNEQYNRNYNLRIYFVAEPKEETSKQCEETVLQLFHDKLGLVHIKERDLDAVHRLGKKNPSTKTPRGIIVRFLSRKTREEVISNRRKLKKLPGQTTRAVVIVDDLTKDNYALYNRARLAENTQQCWTKMGKIYIKTKSGHVKQVQQPADIDDPPARKSQGVEQNPQQMRRDMQTQGQPMVPDRGAREKAITGRSRTSRGVSSGGRGRGVYRKEYRSYARVLTHNCDNRDTLSDSASEAEWKSQSDTVMSDNDIDNEGSSWK